MAVKLQLYIYLFLIYGLLSFFPASTPRSFMGLLVEETFEGESYFKGAKLQAATSYGFRVADQPVYKGAKSGRFELRDTDAQASGGTRAEFLFPEETKVREGFYTFAAYFPSKSFKKDSSMDHINQWHQGKGSGSPALMLITEDDQFIMFLKGKEQKHQRYVLGRVRKDMWHTFAIHIVHSSGNDGLVEVWLNEDKVLSYIGPTMYSGFGYPRWKVGIYKDDWNHSRTTDTDRRVYFIDNVRLISLDPGSSETN
ncbi:polysaccharide lyase [Pontibacter kalidii]|uniref:polysaccharide lyase n=1 Tax=Pontibacter kalidii TaxID=2592049 RepID=UPI00224D3ABE|nr:polysaccharide lyase [Pontibacter kalidii]